MEEIEGMDKNSMKRLIYDHMRTTGRSLDAIVVEGFDGVGKGKVLNLLAEIFGVTPYRPDYNLWQKYDHRPIDRWKVSGFFWDIYRHFREIHSTSAPMLFDRGVISGAVYNRDYAIAEDYKNLIKGMNVLHILVICREEDYYKFMEIRGVDRSESESFDVYLEYTKRYIDCFNIAEADYMVYENYFDESESERLSKTCAGCGHYSYGWCRHPDKNMRVSGDSPRCSESNEQEVQDNYDNALHRV